MHNDSNPDPLDDMFVSMGASINRWFYWALAGLYGIIVEIAECKILSTELISGFFSRVQLIIGIFMMFRLSMTVLQGIVDPDKVVNSDSGMKNIIVKIITGLVFLSMLVPISNIPKNANKYEQNVKNNGILFGTLYEFQTRILEKDILGKLVLARNNEEAEGMESGMGETLASAVLKSFLTPNMKSTVGTNVKVDPNTGRYKQSDLECKLSSLDSDHEGYYDLWYSNTATTGELLDNATRECKRVGATGLTDIDGDQDRYQFNFSWFGSLIVVIIFVVIFILLCVEVAKRAIKLAILRLIAPIPIISYMGSNSDMRSSRLGAWIQLLITTYLDLFINLAMIFFAMSIIVSIATHGLAIDDKGNQISLLGKIFIYIALLLFVKEGPKFIKQALGMKDEGGNGLLSGLGKVAGVAAGAAALGGKKLAGGAYTKARGGSFREGAAQFQSNNKLFAAKRSLDENNEALQGKREIKQMDRNWKQGKKWYDEENPYSAYSNEYAKTMKARDDAKEEAEKAAKDYYAISHSNADEETIAEAYKNMTDKQGAYEGAQAVHEAMRKKHTKDAKREDQISFYKHNKNGNPVKLTATTKEETLTPSGPSMDNSPYTSELYDYEGSGSYSSIDNSYQTSSEPAPEPSMEGSGYTSEGMSSGGSSSSTNVSSPKIKSAKFKNKN